MVQPIFFPFTHLQRSDIEALSLIFTSILFFPLSSKKEFEKSFDSEEDKKIFTPVYTEDKYFDQVKQKVNEYRSWGELNKDNSGMLKTFLQDQPYLTDKNSTARIRSNIGKTHEKSEDRQSNADSLFNSLIFLRLAKIHDMEKEGIGNKLDTIGRNEQKLFSNLRGAGLSGKSDNFILGSKKQDLGEYMTARRINTWAEFFNEKMSSMPFDNPLVFVTTSIAVFEYLLSVSKNKIKILDIDNLKVHEKKCDNKIHWVKTFNECVESLISLEQHSLDMPDMVDDNCSQIIKVKLYLLGEDAINIFPQSTGQNIPVLFVSI